jgi:hypothetical protein
MSNQPQPQGRTSNDQSSPEMNPEEELIRDFLIATLGEAIKQFNTHMPEHVVFRVIRLLGPAMNEACKKAGIDSYYTKDININYPDPH